MSSVPARTLRLLVATVAAVLPAAALAESIASSAASSASIAASSASESLGASSNSSKGGGNNNTARAGDYRIEAITPAAQPGKVQLALAPLAPAGDRAGFVLTLPRAALEREALGPGDAVGVRERPYGFEFARADTRQAFFLVLDDAWHRELDPRPVGAAAARSAL